jgi:menaquinone-dependent protoporphyrinogen oxidase
MKTLIVYATRHGSTQKVARRIAEETGETQLISVKEARDIDFSKYETILLGSSIHAGRNQTSMQQFCKRHLHELLQKRVGLFLCCLNPKEFEQSMSKAYPDVLQRHAFAYERMGGEYLIEKMNFIERFLVKRIVGVTESSSLLNEENITRFIQEVNKQSN